MTRVHVICEGQTEETFIKEVLAPSFYPKGIYLMPTLIGKRGGYFKFERLLKDVRLRLLCDKTAFCTTLFDFYGLPEDFPGKSKVNQLQKVHEKSAGLMNALQQALIKHLGDEVMRRFIPYVQMYEFEGLLFSDPKKLAGALGKVELVEDFLTISQAFNSPEEINNSRETAPSKRIQKLYRAYDKPIHGSLAALEIGLDVIRAACQGFDAWLKQLEAIGSS